MKIFCLTEFTKNECPMIHIIHKFYLLTDNDNYIS